MRHSRCPHCAGGGGNGIPRNELYVTRKLSNDNHGPDDVRRSFDQTLKNLGLEQIDLFLIHWPVPTLYGGDYISTWKAMTELVKGGRLRTAGVSNFQPEHLDRIVAATGVGPAVNQIEVHPYLTMTRPAVLRSATAPQWKRIVRLDMGRANAR